MSADDESVWAEGVVAVEDWLASPEDSDRAAEAASPKRPWLLVLGILAVLVLVTFLITSLGDPDVIDAPAEPDNEEPVESVTGFDALAPDFRAEQTAAFLAAHPAAGDHLMFVRAEDSLALIDFRDGSSTLLEWGVPGQVETVGFLYMASERGSWVVDPDDLSRGLRLAPVAQIGVLETPTRTAVLAEASGVTTVFGGFFDGRSIRILAFVPVGADAQVIQDLGVLISPLSGGSYLVQETAPEKVSDGRIVSANKDWYAEIVCNDQLHCTGNLQNWHTETLTDLPIDVLTTPIVQISPDGRWILSGEGGDWSIYDVTEQTTAPASSERNPNPSVTWSPDSSFFLWIEGRTLYASSPEDPSDRVTLALDVEPLADLVANEIGFLAVAEVG